MAGKPTEPVLVRFFVQAQLPGQLPFEQPLDEARDAKARGHVTDVGINVPALVGRIRGAPEAVNDLFGFVYKLKTGKLKAGELFLKTAGLLG